MTNKPEPLVPHLKPDVDPVAVLYARVEEVVAQRDALQARIDAYEGDVERQEKMTRLIENSSFSSPEAIAMREQTPPEVAWAIVKASEYRQRAEAAEAERDRLREIVEAAIRHVEQEQFRGNGSDQLSDLYRILGDESIARVPDPPVGQPDGPDAGTRCTSCGTVGTHLPMCPLYDPGDVGGGWRGSPMV